MLLSDITRNLNSEIVTKNLVNFKRWDGIQNEKLKYYGSSQFLGSHHKKKTIYMGELPNKGGGGMNSLQI